MWRRSVRATAQNNGQAKGEPQQSETLVTTQRLKQDIRKWELRRDFLEKKAMNLKTKAKALNAKGERSGALLHIKKMKLYEKEILKIDSSILQLEEQIIGLESTSMNAEIIEAQERGLKAQKANKISVERVQKLKDGLEEINEQLEETTELLMGEDGLDDDSLLDEFEKLMTEDDEEELVQEAPVKKRVAPVRVATTPTEVLEEDDDEMKTLKRLEMSMRGLLDDLDDAPTGKPQIKQPAKAPKKAVAQGGGKDDALFAELEAEMMS